MLRGNKLVIYGYLFKPLFIGQNLSFKDILRGNKLVIDGYLFKPLFMGQNALERKF